MSLSAVWMSLSNFWRMIARLANRVGRILDERHLFLAYTNCRYQASLMKRVTADSCKRKSCFANEKKHIAGENT